MRLVITPMRMPGCRRHVYQALGPQFLVAHPRLSRGYTKHTGHNNRGRRTVTSKGAYPYQPIFYAIGPLNRGLYALALVTSFRPCGRRRHGSLAILHTVIGAWLYAPATKELHLFDFIQSLPPYTKVKQIEAAPTHWWRALQMTRPHSYISYFGVTLREFPRFARAPGSAALVLAPRIFNIWALVKLPSGLLYLISAHTHVVPGALYPTQQGTSHDSRAGARRNLGEAPQVRGTVKNPNDHPHGGRTRAIRYPRTPWGRTAKASRAPRLIPRYKALKQPTARAPVISALPVDAAASQPDLHVIDD